MDRDVLVMDCAHLTPRIARRAEPGLSGLCPG